MDRITALGWASDEFTTSASRAFSARPTPTASSVVLLREDVAHGGDRRPGSESSVRSCSKRARRGPKDEEWMLKASDVATVRAARLTGREKNDMPHSS